jgi:UDP-N-acetylglucosamine/UDP-N-acetylgalactosamine diphosphorylase
MENEPLIAAFQAVGQGQVFAHWATLSGTERAGLLAQAAEIDLTELARLNDTLVVRTSAPAVVDWSKLAPAPCVPLPAAGGEAGTWAEAEALGMAALRQGRVAAFTVAGGQGTRLGFPGPKGTFPVSPLKQKTLFQIFAEKIKAAGLRAGRPLHWFIMTSHANHEETEHFFVTNKYFGLDVSRVHFFRQGRMPAVDFNGKLLLETPATLALSPDGHGGSLRALHRSGALDLMQAEGIDTISYFQVDNPLVRCLDAAFIGFHLRARSEMSSKMVRKAYAEEKVGHFCQQAGQVVVIEYSDMPLAMQRELEIDGTLRFGAGSIAIHLIDREFARRMAAGGPGVALPFHRAEKKIATIDAQGQPVQPSKANGVKFELFVFDALPFARNSIVIETARADDFSPVKNAEGLDSPQSSRADQLRQYARWLQSVGVVMATDPTGLPQLSIEISPLFGDDATSFAERWRALPVKPAIIDGLYLA